VRRAGLLELQVRRQTGNSRTGNSDSISSEEFLQYFTDAQLCIYRRMLGRNSKFFRTEAEYDASGAERYALPADCLGQSVITVEFSSTGGAKDYRALDRREYLERATVEGDPLFYILDGANVLLNPYPTTGTVRLVYNKELPRVDKRRSTVSSHTKSTTALSALTLVGYTADDYDLSDHLTVVDFNGVVKMRGIPYTAVDSGTGAVSIYGSSYTFPDGSTMSNGDYVCLGANASSHVQLPDFCEDFVLLYCAKRIMNRESSSDAADADPEVQRMAAEIIDLWSDMGGDVSQVTILNQDFDLEY
jgi:hypothetical protein